MADRLKDLYARITTQQVSMTDAIATLKALRDDGTPAIAPSAPELAPASAAASPGTLDARLGERALGYFRKLIAGAMKLPVERVEVDAALEEYGIDSIMVMEVTSELEKPFGSLSKTLLFEYQTIRALAGYFVAAHREALVAVLGVDRQAGVARAVAAAAQVAPVAPAVRARVPAVRRAAEAGGVREAIAVIGMSGRYPQAANLAAYWENLRDGRDCITEIPASRWDHTRYFDAEKGQAGKTYSKWGGFIEGVDEFDPLFFGISPREAEIMDPQERLFLQCAYEAIEDAGYTKEALAKGQGGGQGNVGVYAGVMYEEYQLYGAQETALGRPLVLSGNPANIANRVSYICNFHGPSLAVDTMCSSSLTTIHLACQSIARGECSVAIAGGVNVSIHPNKYLMLGLGRFASSEGVCRSFGEGGDGYVPGEGVGAVLLKPLGQAIADGDHIYGVIKASAINHGGKTNGYTVPNPNAQGDVIAQAMAEAGVPARAISYIEAHGTGTSLGDPIEIAGLSKAYGAHTADVQYCAIGSAKSNIGHCESAAGIAGVTKVLLQLAHKQLVPSLHSGTLNPNIDFARTPFVVQQGLGAWARPVVEVDGRRVEYPRIAGVSSFGAGGSNAHVVIEEYEAPAVEASTAPVLIVLSAKTEAALARRATQLEAALRGASAELQLADVAYTLQVGREAMEERLALVVATLGELADKLAAFVAGGGPVDGLHRGQVKRNKDVLSVFGADEELEEAIAKWIQRGKLEKLAELWVKGLAVDWHQLYAEQAPRRVSLPTYPFERERYWAPTATAAIASGNVAMLHPLVHRNTSDLEELRYTTELTGEAYYLADHVVAGHKVLPGAAQLEMARAAVALALSEHAAGAVMELADVVFVRPVVVDAALTLHIALAAEADGAVGFEIYSGSGETAVVHSEGRARAVAGAEHATEDLAVLRAACTRTASAEACYARFAAMGLAYGRGMQGLQEVGGGQDAGGAFAVAQLRLPAAAQADAARFVLSPSLVDASLQASIGLMLDSAAGDQPALPFAIDRVVARRPVPAQAWAVVRPGAGSTGAVRKLDIAVCDAAGELCVALTGFSSRLADPASEVTTLVFEPRWATAGAGAGAASAVAAARGAHWVMLCEAHEARAALEARLPGARCVTLGTPSAPPAERYAQCAEQLLTALQGMVRDAPAGEVLVQLVVGAQGEAALLRGLCGMLKSAQQEQPRLVGQVLAIGDDVAQLADRLQAHVGAGACEVRYVADQRQVLGLEEVVSPAQARPWRDDGVYLITGGTGGLGLIFAREIAQRVARPTLVLTARSALQAEQRAALQALVALGARVEFQQVDVTDRAQVEALIAGIRSECGELHGIVHSAGVLRDGLLMHKTAAELAEVLAPKVAGVVNLDLASRGCALECFVLFSSTSGALGNVGQADYAAGNAFMDAYAERRNALAASGERSGRALSVSWPLWAHGGMQVDGATRQRLRQGLGMAALDTAEGLAALERAWATGRHQILVIAGDARRLRRMLGAPTTRGASPAAARAGTAASPAVIEQIRDAVGEILRFDVQRLDAEQEWSELGFDSVTLVELSRMLVARHGFELQPNAFFEHTTIRALAAHLTNARAVALAAPIGADHAPPAPSPRTARGTRGPIRRAAASGATTAGLRIVTIPGEIPIQAALYYPSDAPAANVTRGVFTPHVAVDGRVGGELKGLLVVSHGASGSEYSHHDLASQLAREGYLVAAVQHPGDNARDTSLLRSAAYFSERPKALGRAIDYLLADPTWKERIPRGRIGAIGHSAGATSVLALLGAVADPRRLIEHCEQVHDDPVVCGLATRAIANGDPGSQLVPASFQLGDPRLRCALLMAPMSVVYTAASLEQIAVPLKIYIAGRDRVFNSKYHGHRLRALVRDASFEEVADAGHFGFMAQPDRSVASVIGDAADNPAGFDRAAFQVRLAEDAVQFFRRHLQDEQLHFNGAPSNGLPRDPTGNGQLVFEQFPQPEISQE